MKGVRVSSGPQGRRAGFPIGLFTSGSSWSSRLFFDPADGRWDIPGIRELLEDVIPKDGECSGFKADQEFPGIGRRVMLLNGCRIDERRGLPAMILLPIQDVTPGQNAA